MCLRLRLLQFSQLRLQGRYQLFDISVGVTCRNMLRAIPIPGFYANDESTFDTGTVGRHFEFGDDIRRFAFMHDLHATPNFEATFLFVIHQYQRDTIISEQVTHAQILAVTTKVSKAYRMRIDDFQKAYRPTTVLHIRPAILVHGRLIKAITRLDELRLTLGDFTAIIVGQLKAQIRFAAAIQTLSGFHARCETNFGKSAWHIDSLMYFTCSVFDL